MTSDPISIDELRTLVTYCAETGVITWLPRQPRADPGFYRTDCSWNSNFAGLRAGRLSHRSGGRAFEIAGRSYRTSRVAWALVTGHWPKGVIRYRDDDRLNDRFANLEDVPHNLAILLAPASSRVRTKRKGVRVEEGRFRATLTIKGRRIALGTYRTAEEASEAYRREVLRRYGRSVA